MSAGDSNTPDLRIPLDPNHSTATSKNVSSFQHNNDMSLSKNDQINATSDVVHYNHVKNINSSIHTSSQNTTIPRSLQQHERARDIMSLRLPHQPIDPTPLRQHMTNESSRHTSEPIMSTTASSFMHNNKTAPLSSQDPKPTPTSNTPAKDPKDQTSNNNDTDPISQDPKDQNDNNKKTKSVLKTYTLGPRKYTFPPRRLDAPWIDPRCDPDLTLAERLEASTDLPLAPLSKYEWKVENEYVNRTSRQPPHRRSRDWKGTGK
jgi:hypothetical protein